MSSKHTVNKKESGINKDYDGGEEAFKELREAIDQAIKDPRLKEVHDREVDKIRKSESKNKEFACPKGICPYCKKAYRGWALAKENTKDENKFCERCGHELEISSPNDK